MPAGERNVFEWQRVFVRESVCVRVEGVCVMAVCVACVSECE